MRARIALALAFLCSCGDARRDALEIWQESPEIRLFAVFTDKTSELRVLEGGEPFQLPLRSYFVEADEDSVEVWVFRFSIADLVAAHPGFSGKSAAEIVPLLQPAFNLDAALDPPVAAEVRRATIARDGPSDVSYEEKTWGDWLTAAGTSRRFGFQIPDSVLCAPIASSTFDGPSDLEISGLAAVSEERVLFTATDPGSAALRVGVIDGETITRLIFSGEDPGTPQGRLSWDRTRNAAFGVTSRGNVYAFDETGRRLPLPENLFNAFEVSAGKDGTVWANSSTGLAFGHLYALRSQEWEQDPSEELRLAPYAKLTVVHEDRVWVWFGQWLHGSNGQRFVEEDLVGDFEGKINEVAADDDGVMYVGPGGLIKLRRGPVMWDALPAFAGRKDNLTVSTLGRGRFVVGGRMGALAVWNGRSWCPIQAVFSGDFAISTTSPNGRSALIAGRGPSARTTFVRLTIPEQL